MATTEQQDGLTPPERLLHEVRREAHYWKHQLTRSKHGIHDAPAVEQARAELTAALENYWTLLKPAVEPSLPSNPEEESLNEAQKLWLEKKVFLSEHGAVAGLYALRDWWESERVVVEHQSSVLAGDQPVQKRVPVSLDLQKGRRVLFRLDQLAAELSLGYDAPSETATEITDELIEEVEQWRQDNLS